MILADKIIDLRKKYGWSQEELAAQLGVSRQSVSKWEGAQSIPDMAKIVQMSELFGVSTDYLLKDDVTLPGAGGSTGASASDPALASANAGAGTSTPRIVGLEEANAFLQVKATNADRVSLGVLLCILSPICLILLGGASSYGLFPITDVQATGIGLMILILMVGIAVALFVTSGLRVQRFEYLEHDPIDTLYGVDGMARERREQSRAAHDRHLVVGIVLCVLAALPLFATMLFTGEDDGFAYVPGVAAILALAGAGAWFIVRASIPWGALQQLLEDGDYTREEKARSRRMAPIGGIYWGLVTAAFLAWSFITGDWDRTWIIWPVAGVAYGAIYGIVLALRK